MHQTVDRQWQLILAGPWVLWPRVDKLIVTEPSAADTLLHFLEKVPRQSSCRVQLSALPLRMQRHALLILLQYPQRFTKSRVRKLLRDYMLDLNVQALAARRSHLGTTTSSLAQPSHEAPVAIAESTKETAEITRTKLQQSLRKTRTLSGSNEQWKTPCSGHCDQETASTIPCTADRMNDADADEDDPSEQNQWVPSIDFFVPWWKASRCPACHQQLSPYRVLKRTQPYLAVLWLHCWRRFSGHQSSNRTLAETSTTRSLFAAAAEQVSPRNGPEGGTQSESSIHKSPSQPELGAPSSFPEPLAQPFTIATLQREEALVLLAWSQRILDGPKDDEARPSSPVPSPARRRLRTAQDWQTIGAASSSTTELLQCLSALMQQPDQISVRVIETGIATILLPIVQSLQEPASRLIRSVVRLSQKRYPRVLLEQLVYPLLTISSTASSEAAIAPGPYQMELCLQVFDADLEVVFLAEALQHILERGFAGPWNEHTLMLLECLLKRLTPAHLEAATGSHLVHALEANVTSPALQNAGLRLAKLFHLLLARYPALVAAHRALLVAVLQRVPQNFLRDSALRKLQP